MKKEKRRAVSQLGISQKKTLRQGFVTISLFRRWSHRAQVREKTSRGREGSEADGLLVRGLLLY